MSKLAVFFPGIGYTADKPLLYYSRKLAAAHGYEVKVLSFSGFPEKAKGDEGKMAVSVQIAITQSREMLKDIDLSEYEEVLFIAKSIGTIAAAAVASESPARGKIRIILYTPLEATFRYSLDGAIVFTGGADPWVGREKSRIPALCAEAKIPCVLIPGANHSLETENVWADITNLERIMGETEDYMRLGAEL